MNRICKSIKEIEVLKAEEKYLEVGRNLQDTREILLITFTFHQ
jgi:hypothetical protein